MLNCKMLINKLNIDKSSMDFGVAITCPFNMDVTSPKVKVIFKCGDMDRRLPFKIRNYYHQKHLGTSVIVCDYVFFIDRLFYKKDPNEPITVEIEFTYGEEVVTSVPFTVSSNVLLQNKDIVLDDKYIEYECSNDAFSDSSLNENDTENNFQKKCAVYDIMFECEKNRIIIQKNLEKTSRERSFIDRSVIIIPLIRFVLFLIRTVLSVILIPWFIVDGFAAALGITEKRKAQEYPGVFHNFLIQSKINMSSFLKTSFKRSNIVDNIRRPIFFLAGIIGKFMGKGGVKQNQVAVFSGRRDEMSGNLKFVYDILKDDKDIDFKYLMFSDPSGHNKIGNILKFLKLYSTSKVVLVDDYFRLFNMVDKNPDVTLIQLWHACGAFKTFGFTRLGKAGGPKQIEPNHRMYDYAIVSSAEIAKHYAEGFGLSQNQVVPTGIPRTDIFMDRGYADNAVSSFYEKYPKLKDKKIMLFAPTFRGNGQMSAYYPLGMFDFKRIYENLGEEYAIIVKLHPFCKAVPEIPEEYSDYIINLSQEDELNDLLFVTDLLVTDYSSVIFEASLLNIPMIFYAFDLYEYISTRDFYYDFENFVPGKIVFSQSELCNAVNDGDFESEKIQSFKTKFFDDLDGQSSKRVAALVEDVLHNKK